MMNSACVRQLKSSFLHYIDEYQQRIRGKTCTVLNSPTVSRHRISLIHRWNTTFAETRRFHSGNGTSCISIPRNAGDAHRRGAFGSKHGTDEVIFWKSGTSIENPDLKERPADVGTVRAVTESGVDESGTWPNRLSWTASKAPVESKESKLRLSLLVMIGQSRTMVSPAPFWGYR